MAQRVLDWANFPIMSRHVNTSTPAPTEEISPTPENDLSADAKALMEATAEPQVQEQVQQTTQPKPTAEDIAEMKRLVAEHEGKAKQVETPTLQPGEMLTASFWLQMDKNGSGVQKINATPAEAMLLVAMHHAAAGQNPIKTREGELRLLNVAVIKRTPREEKQRLLGLYSQKKVNAIFPGAMPQMPVDFEEAGQAGLETGVPDERLMDKDIAA